MSSGRTLSPRDGQSSVAAARPALLARVRSSAAKIAASLATPLVPGDYLDLINPLRSGADLRARIIARTRETARSATLTLRPSGAWRGHLPGQYVRIGVDIDGVRRWRAYSITSAATPGTASSPATGPTPRTAALAGAARDFTITVTMIDDGLVSAHLVTGDVVGSLIALDHPTGDFLCPTPAPARALLLTGGSGLTPVLGMLRSRVLAGSDVVLIHSVRDRADCIAPAELAAWGTEPGHRFVLRETNTEGQLALADLDSLVPDWRERHAWACGPTSLLDDCEAHWQAAGLAEHLTVERFRPTLTAIGDGGTATFATSNIATTTDGATALLDAGEAAGVLMPSGCRMGICFGCLAPLTAGSVADLRNGEITTAADGERIPIQTCISAAAGNCTIDL